MKISKIFAFFAVLNWFEDRVAWNRGLTAFIKTLVFLILLRVRFKKVVWVRHNLKPHTEYSKVTYGVVIRLLNLLSDQTVTHRPVNEIKSVYVPHPMYAFDVSSSGIKDVPFLWFGAIKRYKGLTELLSSWPSNVQLIIAGKCSDDELLSEITDVIETRKLKVTWYNRFLEYDDLNALIARSDIVVMSHSEDSMIVSGIFYHAMSVGSGILMKKCRLYDEYLINYPFVASYSEGDLSDDFLNNISRRLPVDYKIPEEFCDENISRDWSRLLSI